MAVNIVAVAAKITATLYNLLVAPINLIGWSQIIPTTSSAGAAVSTLGKVTLTACATVTLTGFSAAADWYKIYIDVTTTVATNINATLGASGAGYDAQYIVGINTATAAAPNINTAAWVLNAVGLIGEHTIELTLYNPALSVATTGDAVSGSSTNPMTTTAATRLGHLLHRSLAAFSSITIACAAGTMTGAIRIEALNNG